MNYQKIIMQLEKENLIDDRHLLCHTHRNYTKTGMVTYTHYGNNMEMPSFSILSIKDHYLCISKASMFGFFKKYYARIDLKKLTFVQSYQLDGMVDIYEFNHLIDEQNTNIFYIISIREKEHTQALVDAIIKFKQE